MLAHFPWCADPQYSVVALHGSNHADGITLSTNAWSTNVQFSGLAPGFVGLYQVNAQVPAGSAAGPAVPLLFPSAASSRTPLLGRTAKLRACLPDAKASCCPRERLCRGPSAPRRAAHLPRLFPRRATNKTTGVTRNLTRALDATQLPPSRQTVSLTARMQPDATRIQEMQCTAKGFQRPGKILSPGIPLFNANAT